MNTQPIGLSPFAFSGPPDNSPKSPMAMVCEAVKLRIKPETATSRWNDIRAKYGYKVRSRSVSGAKPIVTKDVKNKSTRINQIVEELIA